MVEYRYHKLARNESGWTEVEGGRLGQSDDYVGQNGFGHEDWNFQKDVWPDGRYHLYVRQAPAKTDRSKTFNIALGTHSPTVGHLIVGFCENVQWSDEDVPDDLLQKRAEQLHNLDTLGELGGQLRSTTIREKVQILKESEEIYWVSVKPADLIILDEPILAPASVLKPNYNRYQLKKLTKDQYHGLRHESGHTPLPVGGSSEFPEGQHWARLHKVRERSSAATREAKQAFKTKFGHLFCEACGWKPERSFPDLRDQVIEAHHDVWLCDEQHGGKTRVEDLKMLCPNCHRAIHRIRPWLRVAEFKQRFF